MLFNVVRLKSEYTLDDVELAIGEMCNLVKNTYRDDGGFIAGQVFSYAGFVDRRLRYTSMEARNHRNLNQRLIRLSEHE